jgi:hypothetical protein
MRMTTMAELRVQNWATFVSDISFKSIFNESTNAEVKTMWIYTVLPPYAFMA